MLIELNKKIADVVEGIVTKNKALENAFFEKCSNETISKEQLRDFLINFYPITETFALAGISYNALIAEYIQERTESGVIERQHLEEFMAKVMHVTLVEFNINNEIAPDKFHFNAFMRLAPKLDVEVSQVKNKMFDVYPETQTVVDNLIRNFKNPNLLAGLANIFVIEYTALNIINCLWDAFSGLKNEGGKALYSSHELEHITLHQVLEIEHDEEAHELLEMIIPTEQNLDDFIVFVEELSLNIGNYWMRLFVELK